MLDAERFTNNLRYVLLALLCTLLYWAFWASMPNQTVILALALLVLSLITIANLVAPITVFYFVIFTSGIAGLMRDLESFEFGNARVSLSGIRWGLIAVVLVAGIWPYRKKLRLQGPLKWLILFNVWSIIRFLVSPSGVGSKDVLFYCLPLLFAIYTVLQSERIPRLWSKIQSSILWSGYIPPLMYAILIPAGLVIVQENGPFGAVDPRPVATYMLIVEAVAIASWRYSTDGRRRRLGAFMTFASIALCVFTLSRIATLVGIVQLVFVRQSPLHWRKLVVTCVIAGLLFGLILVATPAMRSRFTSGDAGNVDSDYPYINTEGRAFFWAIAVSDWLRAPVFGKGMGSSRILLAQSVSADILNLDQNEYHPHNELIQVLHDLGLVGLVLVISAWTPLLTLSWKEWKRGEQDQDPERSQVAMASVLAALAVFLNALVGNTLHEAFIMLPVVAIYASMLARRERAPHFAF